MLVDKNGHKHCPNTRKRFDCINKIIHKLPWGRYRGRLCSLDIGSKSLLVSVDSFIEDVHFKMTYFKLEELGDIVQRLVFLT
jgi:hypothetical protein